MGVDHGLGFMAGEIAQLDGEVVAFCAVVARSGEKCAYIFDCEFEGVFAGGAEVQKLDEACFGIVKEVCPVGVCLHVAEFGDFAEAEAHDLGADPVALGLREGLDFGYCNAL